MRAIHAATFCVAAFAVAFASPRAADAQTRLFPTSGTGVLRGGVTAVGGTNAGFGHAVYDVDGAAGTADSSSEVLALPAGATIRAAYLVWGQDCINPCSLTGPRAIDPSDYTRSVATLITPDGTLHTVNAVGGKEFFASPGSLTTYGKLAYTDVTAILQPHFPADVGGRRITVGNIHPVFSGNGSHRNTTWAIFVVYDQPTAPIRAIAVDVNGVALPTNANETEVTLSIPGIQLPAGGPITGTVVVQAADGQASLSLTENIYIDVKQADHALINGVNPLNGVWNHSISRLGVASTTALPDWRGFGAGAAGLDLDVFDITGLPTPGAQKIDLIATTTPNGQSQQEYVVIMALALATDVEQPALAIVKSGTVLAGGVEDASGVANVGDRIEYGLAITNSGNDTATETVISDAFPAGTSYVPGSLVVDGVSVADANPDVTLTAASISVALGTIGIGGGRNVSFRVNVDAIVEGRAIRNVAMGAYDGAGSGTSFTTDSNPVVTPACGNGLHEAGEACDAGAANGDTACGCDDLCLMPDADAVCDDGEDCTADTCDAQGACAFPPIGAGESCDDGSACTESDVCDAEGTCAGEEITCAPEGVCDAAACDEATGACFSFSEMCEIPVFYGVVQRSDDVLGSIRCWSSGGVVQCDMDGGVLAIGPAVCE